jgi:purine-binding chemotaxis protein CheW
MCAAIFCTGWFMTMEKEAKLLDSLQVVCFKVGSEEYGIEILKVQEILKLPKVTKLPKSAAFIMGVIDLRGKVIPIVNLAKRFNQQASETEGDKRAIVVDIYGKQIGLAIDTVSHVVKFDAANIEPPPPIIKGISGRYIIGVAKHNQGYVVILDIDKIFSSEELKVLTSA